MDVMTLINTYMRGQAQGGFQRGSPEFASFQQNIMKAVQEMVKLANNQDLLNTDVAIYVKLHGNLIFHSFILL